MSVARCSIPFIAFALLPWTASAQPLTFQRDDHTSTASARGIASADFNRDGWLDIVTAHNNPDGISVLMNRGSAGGYDSSFIPLPGGPFDVAAADVNKDGAPDVAVANADRDAIDLLYNDGTGRLQWKLSAGGVMNPRGVTIADVDRDGNPDLVFTEFTNARVGIAFGDGAGSFGGPRPVIFLGVSANPQGVAVADFNLDGRPDLVTVSSGTFNIGVTFHFADAAPGAFTRWDVQGTPALNVVALGDFDKDGRPDVAAAGSATSNITTLVNTRAGFSIRTFPSGGSSPRGIAAADLNRDGAPDLVTAARGSNAVQVAPGDGAGRFGAPVSVAAGTGSRAVAVGDFDRDGRIDIATANEYVAAATVLSNVTAFPQAAFKFRRQWLGPGDHNSSGADDVAIADFDHDGRLDAVSEEGLHVRFGNGSDLRLGEYGVDVVELDANRDGHPDIVSVSQGSSISGPSRLGVFMGDGRGNFPGRRTVATSLHALSIETADLNLDGRADIVLVGQTEWSGPTRIHLFAGDGNGGFALAADYPADEFPFTLRIGDVDRDGDPDLVTAGNRGASRAARVVTRLNDRNWTLSAPRETAAPALLGISYSDLGDLNHDGFLDVVVAGSSVDWQSQEDVAVMLGGPAGFGSPAYLKITGYSLGLSIADFTADGHLDAMTHAGVLFKGRGDGTFEAEERFDFYAPGEVADFNGDGLPDLVGGSNHGAVELILNQRGSDNAAPTVSLTANIGPGLTLPYSGQFGDGGSQNEIWAHGDDPDLHQLRYTFRDARGEFDSGTFPFFWPRYLMEPGQHEVFVEVSDGRGGTATGSIVITILPEKEIVLHVGAAGWDTTARGNWGVVDDPSAASGKALHDLNAGLPKVTSPSPAPANYVDVGFAADSTQTYKLWVRLKADGNAWSNDSLWLQLTNAVDSAGRSIAPGTSAGIEVNLEECSGCGVSGWGWRDEAWGQRDAIGTLTVRFTRSGWQRLRIQTREDGVSVDQVVLSSEQYRTTRPGAAKNDATILPPRFYW
ncbi:MAG TPA: VCBS repeat-containing protein [Vicinamibacterales bacterium]|nr:VCBS repeat-containing protein [Vicinamibacterales bacterium]